MRTLADVNVLFAILVAGHVHHGIAWRWWEERKDESVVLCWPTRLGILRLLTNPRAMSEHPVLSEQALNAWDELFQDPRTIWCEASSELEPFFRQNVAGRRSSPNLWNDAWLAALAESMSIRLTSFDAGFHSLGLTDFEHLRP